MKKWFVLVFFVLLTGLSGFLISLVNVNYNLQKYLPDDSLIVEGMDIYQDEFGTSSSAYIAIDEPNLTQALAIKTNLLAMNNVKEIEFVDTYLNEFAYSLIRGNLSVEQQSQLDFILLSYLNEGMSYPEAFYNLSEYFPSENKAYFQDLYQDFVSEDYVLYQVIFETSSADTNTEDTLKTINDYLEKEEYQVYMKGDTVSNIFTKNTIDKETTLITIILIPLVILVLLMLSKSFFDIIIFIIVTSVSIIINLGTNALLPNISYITQSMAIALQLAISLDYIIFALNSYHEERKNPDNSVDQAIKLAFNKIRRPIIASALTTMVSFLALIIMDFSIGMDIGIVFAKAILISLISTIFLLPVIIKIFAHLIDKTRIKNKLINFHLFGKFYAKQKKFRFIYLAIIGLLIVPLVYLQTKNDFVYGVNGFSASEGTTYSDESRFIDEEFGMKNNYFLLVEKDDSKEFMLYQNLSNKSYVKNLNAGIYYKNLITDPIILSQITESYYSENYAIMSFVVESEVESEESFLIYEEISSIVNEIYTNQSYILGETPVSYNLKDIILNDFLIVIILAVAAVVIIVLFSFKNFLIPVILITVIETAVFLSMSVIGLFNQDLVFLAYLIVSTILLGATIDYAILLSKRYLEIREFSDKEESIKLALLESSPSIITSALLFIIAGLVIAIISSITSIAQIGLLIALGASISLLFVLIFLPEIIHIFDSLIMKSKIKANKNK